MQRIEDRGVQRTSETLEGCQIAFAVSGGIGSVEAVKIIREIRRRGGQVTAFMSPEAQKFITPLSLEWAANRPVVLEQSAQVEHLELYNMVVVAPATLNTITKASLGISDNVVLLLVASHLGKRGKILLVPTMNESLYLHPAYEDAKNRLMGWGVSFYASQPEEDRLKMPDPGALVDFIEREFKSK